MLRRPENASLAHAYSAMRGDNRRAPASLAELEPAPMNLFDGLGELFLINHKQMMLKLQAPPIGTRQIEFQRRRLVRALRLENGMSGRRSCA